MKTSAFVLIIAFLVACAGPSDKEQEEVVEQNPAAEGFDATGSDEQAVLWADAVMQAMGGREKWDGLRYLSWNFFGARDLVWDKLTGRVRIDFPRDSSIFLVNINTGEGKVWRKGREIVQPDSLKLYVERGKGIWINDAYWLVMPFKLKDSGVTLTYAGQEEMTNDQKAHVLELNFEGVGRTPHNKYQVFIDPADSLIKQWAYYKEATQDTASAIWPWDNYQDFDGLLLSTDRSDDRGPKNVKVHDDLPDEIFESFEPIMFD